MELTPGKLYKTINKNNKFYIFEGQIDKSIRQQKDRGQYFYIDNDYILFLGTIYEQNCWQDTYDIWVFSHKGKIVEFDAVCFL